MKISIHAIAGVFGMVMIVTFFLSTISVELWGNHADIAFVKRMIVYGLFILVPAMIITGMSGRAVVGARQGRLIKTKMRRMGFIAANGLLILVPCAIILNNLANAGNFDTVFYTVQTVELLAGAINISLMGLSSRDGLLLTGRLKKKRKVRMVPGK